MRTQRTRKWTATLPDTKQSEIKELWSVHCIRGNESKLCSNWDEVSSPGKLFQAAMFPFLSQFFVFFFWQSPSSLSFAPRLKLPEQAS